MANFRPDGTVRLQKAMLELVQLLWLDFGETDTADLDEIETAENLSSIICSLKIAGAKALLQTIQDALGKWQDTLSSSALEATSALVQK